ncbi:hypothetical protein WR25_19069 [Diploscapter pachys]|uniref:Uncharacterized protein n=1 Tax=Diploscapter pachys TaxID=2018661 RepID=A0A2A2L6M4_9BILA|nr:hypothetical protein WR25_19069 [Diploscapter pachys]
MTSWMNVSPQICCVRILIIVYRHTLPLPVVSLPPPPMISQSSSFTGRFPPALLLWWGCAHRHRLRNRSIDRLTDFTPIAVALWKSGRKEERTAQIIPPQTDDRDEKKASHSRG